VISKQQPGLKMFRQVNMVNECIWHCASISESDAAGSFTQDSGAIVFQASGRPENFFALTCISHTVSPLQEKGV
jgi:hypothetical protein